MKQFIKNNWFKILAVVLLFWALGDHPYSYYQFLRWAIMIIGVYSAYLSYENKRIGWVWIFGIMAILFNPIIPFYLSKDTWQMFDFAGAIVFVVSLFDKNNMKKFI
jgi:FtsH-binding integral membrane protein